MYETLLIVSVVIFAGTCVAYARHPAASAFHPATFYLLFHGFVFVVRPIIVWFYGYTAIYEEVGFFPTEWEKTQVLICTNLALVVFMAVVLAIGREPVRFRQDRADEENRRLLLRRFWFIAPPLALLGLSATLYMWEVRAQGLSLSQFDTRTGAMALNQVNGYYISAVGLLTTLAAMIVYLGRFRLWTLIPFLAFAVLGFGSGARGYVVASALMLAVLYLFERRRRWPNWVLPLAAIPLLLGFTAVRDDRGGAIRESFGVENRQFRQQWQDEATVMEGMDFANMEFFEFLVWSIPKRTGSYDYFLNNLQLLTEPIPRALWPGKPVGPPIKLFELYRYSTPLGLTNSMPGMGWFNFGYAGVVIWSALFAAIYGYGYRAFAAGQQGTIAVLAYAVFLSTSLVAFRDGSLLTILKQLLFYFLPVGILWLAARATGVWPAAALRERDAGAGGAGGTAPGGGDPLPLSARARRRLAASAAEAPPAVVPLLDPALATGAPASLARMSPRQRRQARIGGA